ncbi:amidohydrolase family protein [Algoriphagus sp. AK58]|uniref:amidohydrolase family protein n=1 Tax=Algoriphagus sp. AK58 TaxID=1406877 RepID=UPI00164F3AF7|nr:amidohydrolase family protein [Algoriphagus sp. AK58]MBC6367914.1 amidohydrolase [Algoriphagus sp. AK58]
MAIRGFYLFLIGLISSCSPKSSVDLLIKNASIISLRSGEIIQDQVILIQGDRILTTGGDTLLSQYEGIIEINAEGKFVLPGLWDNHVHFGGAEYIDENEQLLPLYVAFGVTSVRDAAGDIPLEVLKWRDEIANGNRTGPRIFTSGPKIEGINSIWPGDLEVGSEEELDRALDSLVKLKVDFVKITDNTLSAELFLSATQKARKRGLPVSGHVHAGITLDEISLAGLSTIEHQGYALRAATSEETRIRNERVAGKMTAEEANLLQFQTLSDSVAEVNFRKFAKQGTGIVPTLLISRNIAYLDSLDFSTDTILNYLGPKLKESYQWRIDRYAKEDQPSRENRKRLYEASARLLPIMQKSGMKIMAGTDAGYLNTYDYPGLGIHLELALMVNYGLSPVEALTASLINGPAYFGLEEDYGAVTSGKKASLLILRNNPLEQIENTQTIESVIVEGKYFSRKDLDRILGEIKKWVLQKESLK